MIVLVFAVCVFLYVLSVAERGGVRGGLGAEEMGETAKGRREWKNNKDRWERPRNVQRGREKRARGETAEMGSNGREGNSGDEWGNG